MALWTLAACASTASPGRAPGPAGQIAWVPKAERCPPEPGLCLALEPADAELTIEGTAITGVAAAEIAGGFVPLPPGIYRVTLRAPGRETWRGEIAVGAGPEPIEVVLRPRRAPAE